MLGRLLDEIEKTAQRPMCWMSGHRWHLRRDRTGWVCLDCGARKDG